MIQTISQELLLPLSKLSRSQIEFLFLKELMPIKKMYSYDELIYAYIARLVLKNFPQSDPSEILFPANNYQHLLSCNNYALVWFTDSIGLPLVPCNTFKENENVPKRFPTSLFSEIEAILKNRIAYCLPWLHAIGEYDYRETRLLFFNLIAIRRILSDRISSAWKQKLVGGSSSF